MGWTVACRFTHKGVDLDIDYQHHYAQGVEFAIAFIQCPAAPVRHDIVVELALRDIQGACFFH